MDNLVMTMQKETTAENMQTSHRLELFSGISANIRTSLNFDNDDLDISCEHNDEDDIDSGISSEDSFSLEEDDQHVACMDCSPVAAASSPKLARSLHAPRKHLFNTCHEFQADTAKSNNTAISSYFTKKSMPNKQPRYDSFDVTDVNTHIQQLLSNEDGIEAIGDMSRPYILPTIPGKHRDLKSISPQTLAMLLTNEFSDVVDEYLVVDCRYPYEYDGGHIKDAVNIWECDTLVKRFLENVHESTADSAKRPIIIFHCEFSSERGPKMARFLREKDREANKDCYPRLNYPEIYILEGGYKNFYHSDPDLCQPQHYQPMDDPNYLAELKSFRSKAKSVKTQQTRRAGIRRYKKHNL